MKMKNLRRIPKESRKNLKNLEQTLVNPESFLKFPQKYLEESPPPPPQKKTILDENWRIRKRAL